MSIKLIKKQMDGLGNLTAALYQITLPSVEGEWVEVDTFGFQFVIPMLGEEESVELNVEYSAVGQVWKPNEGSPTFSLDMTTTSNLPLWDSAQGDPNTARMRSPMTRFKAAETDNLGSVFYLYCL